MPVATRFLLLSTTALAFRDIAVRCRKLVAVLAVILTVGTAAISQAQTGQYGYLYGAFAYSPAQHSVVATGWGPDAVSAEEFAIVQCRQLADDCLPVTWYRNAYASFAVGAGTGRDQAWAWGRSGISAGDADERSLSTCRANGGGTQCSVVLRDATLSPSVSEQAGDDLVGRVCMVYAPNGADLGIGPFGHVGWAYLIHRDAGIWFFGANEGPSFDYFGAPSKTWLGVNGWPSLVISFKAEGNYHPANYYQYIRCSSGTWHNPTNAAATADTQQTQPYWFPTNDCLSNAVDIFQAYGVPQLPSYIDTWQPNAYFQTALDSADFELTTELQ